MNHSLSIPLSKSTIFLLKRKNTQQMPAVKLPACRVSGKRTQTWKYQMKLWRHSGERK